MRFNSIIISLLIVLNLSACKSNEKKATFSSKDNVKLLYEKNIQNLKNAVEEFKNKIDNESSVKEIQDAFLRSRLEYKKIEFLAEYFNPTTALGINGPPLDEVEEDDPLKTVIPPEGFQAIEEYIFPDYKIKTKTDLQKEVNLLISNINRLAKVAETTHFTDTQILDAIRLEIVRIISLGISGFDSPIANHSIPEAYSSIQSLQQTLNFYKKKNDPQYPIVGRDFNVLLLYLQRQTDFNTFDRVEFITKYLNPLTRSIYKYQNGLKIPFPSDLKAFAPTAETIFDKDAFNPNYFAPGQSSHLTPARIELGKILFFEPALSGNNSRSCASCHSPQKGFADGVDKSIAFNFQGKVNRNAPTILNAALQSALFHDTRVMFLEDQASDVLTSKMEMHGSLGEAVEKLKQSDEYLQIFKNAFSESEQPITQKNIKIALASYTRSLIALDSRFDKHIRGEQDLLSANEINGFNVFMGKGKCGTCHFAPLFNGVVPPSFEKTEAEVIGVPAKHDTIDALIDGDEGKYVLHKIAKHKFAFKTPTIRNVELTAPYMHNGLFNSMEEVIDFYNRGGGNGLGLDLPNQTLPEDRLNLNKEEKKNLISFMKSLTDTTGTTSRPIKLPTIPGENFKNRKVGGIY